jgi:inosine/xanthosine triphosphatase
MKTIAVASNNPVKLQTALRGFQRMFPGDDFSLIPVSVPSGVSIQPVSDAETLQGALNRAQGARKSVPAADFWVGIEGGVQANRKEMEAFAWIVVCSKNATGKGRTASFFLPAQIVQLIQEGHELGEADDIVFNRTNSKQSNGAIGILTGDVIDRVALYEMAVIMALIPFKNPELYSHEN